MAVKSETKKTEKRVKRPIKRTLIIRVGVLAVMFSILFAFISYRAMSRTLYDDYNDKLIDVITYIENNADADDLAKCIESGEKSEKYEQFQKFLNGIIDDLRLDYIYIVIPMENVMVNTISATSKAEIEAGEDDMPLLFATDAYSARELARFRSFWDNEEIAFFEESSDYGAFYTGCKPLRDSSGKTVSLICADISLETVYKSLNDVLIVSIVFSVITVGLFVLLVIILITKEVTKPLVALENSTIEFAKSRTGDGGELQYNKPDIGTKNEVQSLGDAISDMTDDIRNYVEETVAAQRRAENAERENERLAAEAAAAAKIAELSKSISQLFKNMPAMTYMKDIESGKYLACNAKFAEYAGKSSPDEVVGLTDRDIYDEETASKFVSEDRRTLEMDEPNVFFEEAADAMGNPRQFQTTKLKFIDPSGELRVLGMSIDVTEMMLLKEDKERAKEAFEKAQSESVTYSNIAHALSLDYKYLYYIDLETDYFIEYGSDVDNERIIEKREADPRGRP